MTQSHSVVSFSSMRDIQNIRNIAIIAHVDHGKTTLVDCMLNQSGLFRENQHVEERMMDSMDLEREKGITIRAKNASIRYKDTFINLIDTPGHADFGGEVERVMGMIDGVLLVVDAAEGPQAQTRFVLRKALEAGAKPLVVINKIDREFANPSKVLDQVFDLFISLNATDEQLDFPVIYASAKNGIAKLELDQESDSIEPLFDMIVAKIDPPKGDPNREFRMLVSNLDYSEYLGRIALGKIMGGKVAVGDSIVCLRGNGAKVKFKISAVFHFEGMQRIKIDGAGAGDIIGLAGTEEVFIGETLTDIETREPVPFIPIDPPTISMFFAVNDSPLAGLDGNLMTARHIRERLDREIRTNVSLQVEATDSPTIFKVNGRGEMHIAVLIEQMRREGFEMLISRPEVIMKKDENGKVLEPIERFFIEAPNDKVGDVMQLLAARKGEIENMDHHGEMVTLEGLVPMRGLIGFESDLVNITRGMGVLTHLYHGYAPFKGEIVSRRNGALVSMENGDTTSYALNLVQERGRTLVGPGEKVYEGMIIGENARENDLEVNPVRTKKLTNMRSSGDGKGIILEPPMKLALEQALEYINDDEYVEVTPKTFRLRKKILCPNERKRSAQRRKTDLAEV
jgi:GTP-binding protein